MGDDGGFEKTGNTALKLDIDYYQQFLNDADISDANKKELIETLWQIVVTFVDLGFDIHPMQQSLENTLHPAVTKMIAEALSGGINNPKEETSRKE